MVVCNRYLKTIFNTCVKLKVSFSDFCLLFVDEHDSAFLCVPAEAETVTNVTDTFLTSEDNAADQPKPRPLSPILTYTHNVRLEIDWLL